MLKIYKSGEKSPATAHWPISALVHLYIGRTDRDGGKGGSSDCRGHLGSPLIDISEDYASAERNVAAAAAAAAVGEWEEHLVRLRRLQAMVRNSIMASGTRTCRNLRMDNDEMQLSRVPRNKTYNSLRTYCDPKLITSYDKFDKFTR